jgi:hypothetical protein
VEEKGKKKKEKKEIEIPSYDSQRHLLALWETSPVLNY